MQGYALSLVPVVAAHVPAARLVVSGLADRVAAAEPGDALFAVTLACHLACRHPCPATHVSARQSAPALCGTRLALAKQGCCGAGGRARRAGAHARGCGGRRRAFCGPGAWRARRCRGRQPPAQRGRGCAVPGALGDATLASVCLTSPDNAQTAAWLCRRATRRIASAGTAVHAGRCARRAYCRRRRRMPWHCYASTAPLGLEACWNATLVARVQILCLACADNNLNVKCMTEKHATIRLNGRVAVMVTLAESVAAQAAQLVARIRHIAALCQSTWSCTCSSVKMAVRA